MTKEISRVGFKSVLKNFAPLFLLAAFLFPAAMAQVAVGQLSGKPEAVAVPAARSVRLENKFSDMPACLFSAEASFEYTLVSAIDRTDYTLDTALYNINMPGAADALVRAAGRGVKVRVIIDAAHVYPNRGPVIQKLIDSGLVVRIMHGRGSVGAMHNKFTLFDRQLLQAGSANWTTHANVNNYENMVYSTRPELLAGFGNNFEWMWSQSVAAAPQPASYQKASVPPPSDPAPSVVYNGYTFPNYMFGPRGGIEGMLVSAIENSHRSVDVAMFSMTSSAIGDALVRAYARGVQVRVMVSKGQKFPLLPLLKKNNIPVRFSAGQPGHENGVMHHKFAVFDGALLINGSHNWTASAERDNAENVMLFTGAEYVRPFSAEFAKRFNAAMPVSGAAPAVPAERGPPQTVK